MPRSASAARATHAEAAAALLDLLLDLPGTHAKPRERRHPRACDLGAPRGHPMPQLVRRRRALFGTPEGAHARAHPHPKLVKGLVRLPRGALRLALEQPTSQLLGRSGGDRSLEGTEAALALAHRRVPSDPYLEELGGAHRA